jgi:hypothetical protein
MGSCMQRWAFVVGVARFWHCGLLGCYVIREIYLRRSMIICGQALHFEGADNAATELGNMYTNFRRDGETRQASTGRSGMIE